VAKRRWKNYDINNYLQQLINFLTEKSVEYNRLFVLTFNDFKKIFDTIESTMILLAFQQSRIDFEYAKHHA